MTVTFSDLGVPRDLADHLLAASITVPTAIQAAALPDALAGRDVCGEAPTGSGKTLAFGLPIIARVTKARPHAPRVLVLAPTRELADQIHRALTPLGRLRHVKVAAVYGGVSFGSQIRALQSGVEILVACPGRLEDLISQSLVDLSEVDMVVLDEADRMADMGFLPAVERLLSIMPADRQTLLFSATLDGAIEPVVRRHLRDPKRHRVASTVAEAARTTQVFWSTGTDDRKDVCAQIADLARRTIVFTRTKRGADRLATQLSARGVTSAALHGDRSQSQREAALRAFSNGTVSTLVATDVAARGIHIDSVAAVVHFDPPASAADYVHRSGRTGRAGAEGLVVTLVADTTRSAVRQLQRDLGVAPGVTRPDLSVVVPYEGVPTPQPEPDRGDDRRGGGGARGPRGPRGNDRAGRGSRSGGSNRGTWDSAPRRTTGSEASAREGRGSPAERPAARSDRTARPDRPHSDRPHSERTYNDRPYNDRAARPDRPYGERPSSDRPYSDRPYSDRPYSDRTYTDRTARPDRPYGERTTAERTYADRTARQDRPDAARTARPGQSERNGGQDRSGPPTRTDGQSWRDREAGQGGPRGQGRPERSERPDHRAGRPNWQDRPREVAGHSWGDRPAGQARPSRPERSFNNEGTVSGQTGAAPRSASEAGSSAPQDGTAPKRRRPGSAERRKLRAIAEGQG